MTKDTTPQAAPTHQDAARDQADKGAVTNMVLTFRLQGERFAITVDKVNEILDPIPLTPVPRAHPAVPALINVRGTVVPLFDIRQRLGMSRDTAGDSARIVVLDLPIADEITRVAVPVDAVESVIKSNMADMTAIPALGARWPSRFIQGVTYQDDELVILLETDALFDLGQSRQPEPAVA